MLRTVLRASGSSSRRAIASASSLSRTRRSHSCEYISSAACIASSRARSGLSPSPTIRSAESKVCDARLRRRSLSRSACLACSQRRADQLASSPIPLGDLGGLEQRLSEAPIPAWRSAWPRLISSSQRCGLRRAWRRASNSSEPRYQRRASSGASFSRASSPASDRIPQRGLERRRQPPRPNAGPARRTGRRARAARLDRERDLPVQLGLRAGPSCAVEIALHQRVSEAKATRADQGPRSARRLDRELDGAPRPIRRRQPPTPGQGRTPRRARPRRRDSACTSSGIRPQTLSERLADADRKVGGQSRPI